MRSLLKEKVVISISNTPLRKNIFKTHILAYYSTCLHS